MEVKTFTQAADGTFETSVMTTTFTDEELKEFYLKEALFVSPLTYTTPHSELEQLTILLNALKTFRQFLDTAGRHSWDAMAKALQTASGTYLVQDNISRKERLKMNQSLGELWSLITLLSGDRRQTGLLYSYFTRHYTNVERLIERYSAEQKED